MISIKSLSKGYSRSGYVLQNLDLEINKSEVICLLGPNGTGKTTLLKTISGYIKKNHGEILYNGQKLENREIHDDFYYSPDIVPFYNYKISDFFNLMNELHDTWDMEFANKLCDLVKLVKTNRIGRLSFGYKRIFSNIVGLALCKPVTIFDEPINGLDPLMRDILIQMINLAKEHSERTIIISTHLVDEVSKVCDRVLIMQHGRIIVNKSIDEINDFAFTLIGPRDKVLTVAGDAKEILREEMGPYIKLTAYGKRPEPTEEVSILNVPLQEFFIKFILGGNVNV